MTRARLGRYIQLMALLQVALYAFMITDPVGAWPFLDPRLLVASVAGPITGESLEYPTLVSWVSAVALLALGEAVVRSRRALIVYAIAEGLYALVFVAFSALMAVAGLPSADEFPRQALLAAVVVFIVASAGPLAVAIQLWLRD